jgi:hypothetical protein
VLGEVDWAGGRARLIFPEGKNELRFFLPPPRVMNQSFNGAPPFCSGVLTAVAARSCAAKAGFRIVSNPGCDFSLRTWREEPLLKSAESPPGGLAPVADHELVLRHAPLLVPRPDQLRNPFTDMPLLVFYEWVPARSPEHRRLRYSVVFSDEDSMPRLWDAESQLERYGRRTDIEWLYEVEWDPEGKVAGRWFQGGVLFGAGHSRRRFRGEFWPGTEHPLLHIAADHNVFSDRAARGWDLRVFHALAPELELLPGRPREEAMLAQPWLFWQSDLELAREGKLRAWSDAGEIVARAGGSVEPAFLVRPRDGGGSPQDGHSRGVYKAWVARVREVGRLPSSAGQTEFQGCGEGSASAQSERSFRLVREGRGYRLLARTPSCE